jgi:transposase
MLTFGGGRIFLVAGATDMRKSFNGLAGIVRERLRADPMSRHLFFFCNRDRNRMKVLVADESGMWVLGKRLDRGTFAWPAASADVVRIEYREEQLALLLHGFDAEQLRARRWKRRDLARV